MADLAPLRFDSVLQRTVRRLFLALIGAQGLHSLEEYLTRLYDVFAPARLISGLLTTNLQLGFAGFNAALVAFGVWCYAFRVRPNHLHAARWIWPWVILELANGVGHLGLAAVRGSYFPGTATAPLLIALAAMLAYQLIRAELRGSAEGTTRISRALALEGRLGRHGEAVAGFIAQARAISPSQAATPRGPGKWTPMQEAAHLALTYTEFSAVFRGAPEFVLLVPPERAAYYHGTVLPRILAGGWFPSGATAPERVQPDAQDHSMATVLARLSGAVDQFHNAVRAAAAAAPDRRWIHPYFGSMTLPDLVDLLTEHARHHARFLPVAGPG